jgi:uncharacterized protein with PQ loop repeat
MGVVFIGWFAAALSSVMMVAQVLRIRRAGTSGVSPATWAIFLVISAYWLIYALIDDLPPLTGSSLFSLGAISFILWQLRERWSASTAVAFVGSLIIVAAALLVSPQVAVWLSGLLAVSLRVPQIYELVTAQSTAGVSLSTWTLAAVMNAMWTIYGFAEGRPVYGAVNAIIGVTSLTVLALGIWRRRTELPVAA